MSLRETISAFAQQLAFEPTVINRAKLKKTKIVIVAGMGGSQLGADILNALQPKSLIIHHRSYGLPALESSLVKQSMVVAISYSGNTEETLDAFAVARRKKIPVAVIAAGGKLLALAQETKIPYVQIPAGIQPRAAVGYMFRALATLAGETAALRTASEAAPLLNIEKLAPIAEHIARDINGAIPVVYSSFINRALSYYWKITLNETGKTPAFANALPEVNHNEMVSFDRRQSGAHDQRFVFVLLKDATDDERIQKRMSLLQSIYENLSLPVQSIELPGASRAEKIFSGIIIAQLTALQLAEASGADPEKVILVEEFKKRLTE